jgi:hypothetical protein
MPRASFRGITSAPFGEGISFSLQQHLEHLRTNVEILTQEAVLKTEIGLAPPKRPALTSLAYEGAAVSVGGVSVPTAESVAQLAFDVSQLAEDVAYILQYLDLLNSRIQR